ncbi:dehydrogenase, FMN-dependent [Dictyocaulus viviparus]|uniref:Dehydrogenase, FMN-dependent n=1 Tax=Dictyocaulus viviparus TaxID=29172 RepID=A0A0D8Y0V2_DICVI|nr:dehydrogenase, FMN-dependent [Dictyocaulus viviparus]
MFMSGVSTDLAVSHCFKRIDVYGEQMKSSQNGRLLLTIDDFRQEAELKLPTIAKHYYEAGANEELTKKRNEEAFRSRLLIRPRCLRDVSKPNTTVEWFGRQHSFPIGIAPTAFHRMAEKDGELSTVKDNENSVLGRHLGASMAESVMIVSSWSTTSIEDIAKHASGDNVELWFQLYIYKERSISTQLVNRAEKSGYKALVLTVDTPVLGRRLIDERNGFSLPDGLSQIDPTLDWSVVEHLLKTTKLPVIVKGVMRGDDAIRAVELGVHGIIVSNHGGRQMDSAPATIEVLPEVAKAVRGKIPIFIDGGIRNGRDIFKSIALGANGVFVGRPILWGLSVEGSQGVAKVLQILQCELTHTMQLAVPGFSSIGEIQNCSDTVVHNNHYAKI